MTHALLTPFAEAPAKQAGRNLFRKQLLPIGSIDYKGRRLHFTRDYLAGLAASFDAGAYDQVPFVLADAENRHNMDPTRAKGEIRAVELADDGLYGLLDLTDEGAQVVRDNPKLGISAQIVEGLNRADGKSFPRAIRHVLGTLDPRVTGMKSWEAVNLANEDMTVVDLTSVEFTQEGATMPELSEDEIAKVRELIKSPDTGSETTPDPKAAVKPEGDPDKPDPSDAEFEAALAEIMAGENADPAAAELSDEARAAIELANANAETARQQVGVLQREAARANWNAERSTRLAQGVPPALLDLAAPWCGGNTPDGFIDLSNTDTTVEQVREAAATDFRKMLDTFKGLVDLSVIGISPEPPDDSAERADKVKAYADKHGL